MTLEVHSNLVFNDSMILINNFKRRPCCRALPGFPFSHRSLRRDRNADPRLCLKKRAHRAERFRPYPRLYPMGEGPAPWQWSAPQTERSQEGAKNRGMLRQEAEA